MLITTSWDDGHPSDLRLADLLIEAGLAATFYLPRCSQRETLNEKATSELAKRFEIGAHTLDHLALTTLELSKARQQTADSKSWIEDITGIPCDMFCPPLGKFNASHVEVMKQCGFIGFRTVELGSVRPMVKGSNFVELPTTVQAHPHTNFAYLKNATRRFRLRTIVDTLSLWRERDWQVRAARLLKKAQEQNGIFHLWGHSWEIDENNQWSNLRILLRQMSELVVSGQAVALTNGALCRSVLQK
jgi:peptidoglycan-N-acetylglucosamine deacetylase